MPQIDVGLGGGASFVPRVLPVPKMRRMKQADERDPAVEVYRLGAVEACVPLDEFVPSALTPAGEITSKSPFATRTMRGAFNAVEVVDVREWFVLEQTCTTALSNSPDAAEARLTFIEKRKALF